MSYMSATIDMKTAFVHVKHLEKANIYSLNITCGRGHEDITLFFEDLESLRLFVERVETGLTELIIALAEEAIPEPLPF